jgi:hypothetical protein
MEVLLVLVLTDYSLDVHKISALGGSRVCQSRRQHATFLKLLEEF